MDVFEYPELHDESIAFNNFFRQLCKLMSACGVKDFSCRVRAAAPEAAAQHQQGSHTHQHQCSCL
jgi:hypothetical protein